MGHRRVSLHDSINTIYSRNQLAVNCRLAGANWTQLGWVQKAPNAARRSGGRAWPCKNGAKSLFFEPDSVSRVP